MAETFLAVKRGPAGFEQRVCVKRILAGYTADTTFVELFLDEARLLANMQCANIVQVYDFGEADGTYYMALELVDGGDLHGLLRWMSTTGQQLSAEAAWWIAGQLLRALHYAHTLEVDGRPLQVVHRDVSPSNLLLSRSGEVKLTDFGIAKSTQRSHKTRTGQTKGKLAYMSPEQVQGKALDARSDLFATGTMLYELLTGVHPFEAPTDLEMLNNIMGGRHQPLASLAPEQPRALVELVESMLSPALEARPLSAADALERLAAVPTSIRAQEDLAQLVRAYREAKPLPASGSGSDPRSGVRVGSSDESFEIRSGDTVALDTADLSSSAMDSFRPPRTGLWVGLAVAVVALVGSLATYLLWTPEPEPGVTAATQGTSGEEALAATPGPEAASEPDAPTGEQADAPQPAAKPPEARAPEASERPSRAEPSAPGEQIIFNQPEDRRAGQEDEERSRRAKPRRREPSRERARSERARAERRSRSTEHRPPPKESEPEPPREPSTASSESETPSAVPGRSGARISADEF